MIITNMKIKNDVPVFSPANVCCNCGATENIEVIPTDLRRMPFMGFFAIEIKLVLFFPYCQKCIVTAKRKRPAPLGILAVAALLSIIFGMCWLFWGPQLSEQVTTYIVAPIIIILSLLLVIGFFAIRKPTPPQTSYYQPVKLLKTGHKWPADITGLELGFTNKKYAELFSSTNQESIDNKKITVKNI